MDRTNEPSDRKTIEFVVTEDSVERQLAFWIRDLVNCTDELVLTLERPRNSYRRSEPISLSRMQRRSCGELNSASRMRKYLACLVWLGSEGRRGHNHPRAVQAAHQFSILQGNVRGNRARIPG